MGDFPTRGQEDRTASLSPAFFFFFVICERFCFAFFDSTPFLPCSSHFSSSIRSAMVLHSSFRLLHITIIECVLLFLLLRYLPASLLVSILLFLPNVLLCSSPNTSIIPSRTVSIQISPSLSSRPRRDPPSSRAQPFPQHCRVPRSGVRRASIRDRSDHQRREK